MPFCLFVFVFFVLFVFFVFLSFVLSFFCLVVFLSFCHFVLLYFCIFVFLNFCIFAFLSFCHHYHNHGINIYYHTNFCSNPTILQFYHIFHHKPLPLLPPSSFNSSKEAGYPKVSPTKQTFTRNLVKIDINLFHHGHHILHQCDSCPKRPRPPGQIKTSCELMDTIQDNQLKNLRTTQMYGDNKKLFRTGQNPTVKLTKENIVKTEEKSKK